MIAVAMQATAIMAVRQHRTLRSTTRTIEIMIRGGAKRVIQDTIKGAPITGQAMLRSRLTLGTILIQVVIKT